MPTSYLSLCTGTATDSSHAVGVEVPAQGAYEGRDVWYQAAVHKIKGGYCPQVTYPFAQALLLTPVMLLERKSQLKVRMKAGMCGIKQLFIK